MKKIIPVFIFSIGALLSSCQQGPSGTCGANLNVCFMLNGNTVAVNAQWYDINPNRHRILWEETSGSDYRNIEIDLYGSLAAMTYTISPTAANNGEASFQYYLSGSTNANYQGISGSIVITSTASNQITGTFSGVVMNGANNYDITDGHIDAVPHQ